MSDSKSVEVAMMSSDTEPLSPGSATSTRKHGFLCGDMFPSLFTFIIFVAYVTLFVNQGILVTATKNGKSEYDYSVVAVVLLTEFGKLVVSAGIFLFQRGSISDLLSELSSNYKLCFWYLVPAGLYCLYNNLSFVNLAWYDPTTYFILLQIRVLLTGATFQVVFRKRLTMLQWFSLIVLTIGCIIKQVNFASSSDREVKKGTSSDNGTVEHVEKIAQANDSDLGTFLWHSFFNVHFVLILTQVLCSCFAGVYNEYLLKEKGNNAHIMVQNIFMYFDSCVCNILVLFYFGSGTPDVGGHEASWADAFSSVLKPLVILIMLNNCAVGIVTSVFLKYLNSIVKVFASSFELAFTALLSWILFGIAINLPTALAIVIVSVAMYLYTVNPVINLPKAGINTSPRSSKTDKNSV